MSLNDTVWCKLGVSKIHGIGVIALRDIPKGQRLYCSVERNFEPLIGIPDDILPEIREIILQRYPLAREGGEYLSPNDDARLVSFINHSSSPNYDWRTDTALVEIKRGDEITEDYGRYTQFD